MSNGESKISGMAIIYTRFSPRRNENTCESCEVQRAMCEQWCHDHGVKVRAYFEDKAVSGKTEIEDRNLFSAINALKKGDVLVACKRDRLSRDLMIGLQIERAAAAKGATVAVASGEVYGNDPSADLMKKILMVIAEWERRIISERTKASMFAHQMNGRRMSWRVPYGYSQDPKNNKRLVINDEEQAVIKEMMRLREGGMAYHRIVGKLDPSKSRSGTWHYETVRRIIEREERMNKYKMDLQQVEKAE